MRLGYPGRGSIEHGAHDTHAHAHMHMHTYTHALMHIRTRSRAEGGH